MYNFGAQAIRQAQAANTVNSIASSKLLNLPAELRDGIYGLALLENPRKISVPDSGRLWPPALLQVCRQIRHEVSQMHRSIRRYSPYDVLPNNVCNVTAIYYGQNTFYCGINSSPTSNSTYLWLTHLPESTIPLIKNLTVSCIIPPAVAEMCWERSRRTNTAAVRDLIREKVRTRFGEEIKAYQDVCERILTRVGLQGSALHFSKSDLHIIGASCSREDAAYKGDLLVYQHYLSVAAQHHRSRFMEQVNGADG
ncbi:hypothetical protein EJ03DRAFT_351039 [Teratosphaeria nubilosa]|uniref:F-box domain-containing protein n=1 Tax=Teratosphaeria nubilosa TaxID=161662 RepID=A0A6G1LB05_9PEZI|nr:hypothetical protein EJ03DRAFT_351039 [Teratosphaeria nubilosa]